MARNKAKKETSANVPATMQTAHCDGLFAIAASELTIQSRMIGVSHPAIMYLPADAATAKHVGKVLPNSVEKSHPYNAQRPHTWAPFMPNVGLNANTGNAYPEAFHGDGGWTKPPYYHLVNVCHVAFAMLRAQGSLTLGAMLANPAIASAKYARQCLIDMVRDLRALSLAFTNVETIGNDTLVTYNAAHNVDDYSKDWPQVAAK